MPQCLGWKSENTLVESILCFYHGSRDRTPATRLFAPLSTTALEIDPRQVEVTESRMSAWEKLMGSRSKLSSIGLLRTARVIHEKASINQHQICARRSTQGKSALSGAGMMELRRERELMVGGDIPPKGLERWGNVLICMAVSGHAALLIGGREN